MEEKKTKKYLENVESRLDEVKAWARDGFTEEEIAEKLSIAYSTFRDYKNKYSALSAVLKHKRVYDDEVVYALHKNTLGGIVDLIVPIKCKKKYYDDNGKLVEEEFIVDAIKQEYIKPDTMAQMYWLNNRVPKDWKSKRTPNDDGDKKSDETVTTFRFEFKDTSIKEVENGEDNNTGKV